MKPVAIFQHTVVGHPGAVLTVLDELSIPWVVVPIMDGVAVPEGFTKYSGLIFMGGGMGVNDGLPWVADEIRLARRARDAGLPMAGHCLGGQILAGAFGADVARNPQMEIGWQPIEFDRVRLATEWLGGKPPEAGVFQWHGDTFSLPDGAIRVATNPFCANQAFVMDDRHIGMQFHLEMTPALIRSFLEANGDTLDREVAAGNPAVNTRNQLLADLEARTAGMLDMLRVVYGRWAQGLLVD